jgi:hypothetical protein
MTHKPKRLTLLQTFFKAGLLVSVATSTAAQDDSDEPALQDATILAINGLEWAVTTNGEDIPWPAAVDYCETLELGGHDDWRLPMLAELETLHETNAPGGESIREPFTIGGCCLWSGESLEDRPAEDGHEIAGESRMYHWGLMFDGKLPYYAVHIFNDGRALCVRDGG